jgi:hypothetical protein
MARRGDDDAFAGERAAIEPGEFIAQPGDFADRPPRGRAEAAFRDLRGDIRKIPAEDLLPAGGAPADQCHGSLRWKTFLAEFLG